MRVQHDTVMCVMRLIHAHTTPPKDTHAKCLQKTLVGYSYMCIYTRVMRLIQRLIHAHMGWLPLVGAFKLQVSFAEYSLFHKALLQKRPIILRSYKSQPPRIMKSRQKNSLFCWALLQKRPIILRSLQIVGTPQYTTKGHARQVSTEDVGGLFVHVWRDVFMRVCHVCHAIVFSATLSQALFHTHTPAPMDMLPSLCKS